MQKIEAINSYSPEQLHSIIMKQEAVTPLVGEELRNLGKMLPDPVNGRPKGITIHTIEDYLKLLFPPPVPLVGTERDAFLVRGEGLFVSGRVHRVALYSLRRAVSGMTRTEQDPTYILLIDRTEGRQ